MISGNTLRALAFLLILVSNTAFAANFQGTVSVPDSSGPSNSDIGVQLVLCTYFYAAPELCNTSDVVISTGTSSVSFSLFYDETETSTEYTATATCISNCEGYVSNSLFLKNDSSSTLTFSTILQTNLSQPGDFSLVATEPITGTLNLPNNNIGDREIVSNVTVCTYNLYSSLLGCDEELVTISTGSSSSPYNLSIIPRPQDGYYRVSTQCIENCSPYLGSSHYLAHDLVSLTTIQTSIHSDLPSVIDFELVEGRPITGTISLPANDVALNDIVSYVRFCSKGFPPGGGTIGRCEETLATIESGSSSVDYEATAASTDPLADSFSLTVSCIEGCGAYVQDTQGLQDDLTFNFESADDVSATSFPDVADIELVRGQHLSGTLSFPNSETVGNEVNGTVELCSYTAEGTRLSCNYQRPVIPANTNTIDYSTVVRTAPSGGHYRLLTNCNYGCGIYLGNARYLNDDLSFGFEPAEVSISALPSTLDIYFDKGTVLTGLVRLPNAQVANSDISNNFEFCSYTASGAYVGCANQYGGAIIAEGENSSPYVISVRPAPADGFYRFRSNCSSNCELYIGNYRYLQSDQSYSFDTVQIPSDTLPAISDVELVEGREVSGTISLANSAISDTDMDIGIRLCSYDGQGSTVGCSSTYSSVYSSVTLENGTNSIPYELSVRPPPNDGSYQFSVNCSSDCGLYLRDSIYLQQDLTADFKSAFVTSSIFPSNVDFTLTEGQVLTGSISLPNGELAESDISTQIQLCSYDGTGAQLDCSYHSSWTIPSGQNQSLFEMSVIPAPSDGFYRVFSACNYNCGLYLSNAQYLQQDLTVSFEQDNLSASQLPSHVDLELSKGKHISGTLSLPNGEVAEDLLTTEVNLCSYSATLELLACSSASGQIDIPQGQNSVTYDVSVLPAPDDGFYQLYGRCSSQCGLYLYDRQYLQHDLSTGFIQANVAALSTPATVDFTLSSGKVITGTIALPESRTAVDEINTRVELCSFGPDNSYLGCHGINSKILSGANSGDYAISILPAPPGGFYQILANCSYSCELILQDNLYLQPDLSIGLMESRVEEALMPDSVDFMLPSGKEVTGLITLPNGLVAEDSIYGSYSLCSYDELGNYIECAQSSGFQFSAGEMSVPYGASLRHAPEGGFYSLSVRCNSGCGLYLDSQRFLQPDLSFTFETTLLSAATFPGSINLPLSRGKVLEIGISLPNGDSAANEIRNDFRFCSMNGLGVRTDCFDSQYDSALIAVGDNATVAFASVRPAPADGFYEFWTACDRNCGPYVDVRQYLTASLSSGFNSALVPASTLPGSISMTLVKGKEISVELSLPNDELAASNISNSVSICSYNNGGSSIDCALAQYDLVIESGTNSVSQSYSLLPAPVDGSYQIYTRCESNCGLFLEDAQYLQADLSAGYSITNVPAIVLPNAIGIELIKGKVISGRVSLPDGDIAPSRIENRLQFCSYTSTNQTVDCSVLYADIQSSQQFVEYSMSIKPAPINGYYRLSTLCPYNCGLYSSETQYLQQDLTIGSLPSNIDPISLPEVVDFELDKGQVLQGSIKLPGSLLAKSPISNYVTFCAYLSNGQSLDCGTSNVTIVTGANSVSFELSTRTIPTGGFYTASFRCSSNCSPYLDVTHYLTDDGSVSFEQFNLSSDDIELSPTFELQRGLDFHGSLVLPNNESAEFDIGNVVELCSYAQDNQQLDCSENSVTIFSGTSASQIELSIRPAPDGGYYRLSTNCQSNCGNYISSRRYLQQDLSLSFAPVNVVDLGMPEPIILPLTKGVLVSGQIKLPLNEVTDSNVTNTVSFCAYGPSSEYLACQSLDATIIAGSNMADYSISVQPAPDGGFYRFTTSCDFCNDYVESYRTLQSDFSFDFVDNLIPEETMPSLVDIELIKKYELSGSISLPNGETANEGFNNWISLCSYDENGQLIKCEGDSLQILSGQNSLSFTLSVQPAPEGGSYRVSTNCSSCDSFIDNTQYLQADLSFGYTEARVPAAIMPESVNFTLDKGKQISIQLKLPDRHSATARLGNSVRVCSYTASGGQVDCLYPSTVYIDSGASEKNVDLAIIAAPEDGYYRVNSSCWTSCDPYLSRQQHLQSDLSFGNAASDVPADALPDLIEFVLIEGAKLTGSVRTPGSSANSLNIRNRVTFCSYTSAGEIVECKTASPHIYPSQLGAEFSMEVIEKAPIDGYYQIYSTCESGCEPYLQDEQYLQEDLSFEFEEANIQAALVPTEVNFTLFRFLPDAYEADDSWDIATIISGSVVQSHNIHNPEDEDWVQFTTLEAKELFVGAESLPEEPGVSISLYDEQLSLMIDSAQAEDKNGKLYASIEVSQLPPGTYYLRVSAESIAEVVVGYTINVEIGDEEMGGLCIPIKTKHDKITLICL